MRIGCIYALADPKTSEVRYIGKTIRKPEFRLKIHIAAATNGSNLYVHRWIRKINTSPQLIIIESTPENELDDAERHWIFIMKMIGYRLTNLTYGGEGGKLAEETRIKISTSNRGKKRSDESRARMSAGARTRKPMTKETRQKISTTQLGKTLSKAHRMKISMALRGRKFSAEHRANLTKSKRNVSDETRRKMSIAARNMSNETRAKMSAAAYNMTKEHRAKLSEVARNRDPALVQETIARLAAINRGRKHTDEARENMRLAQLRINEQKRQIRRDNFSVLSLLYYGKVQIYQISHHQ